VTKNKGYKNKGYKRYPYFNRIFRKTFDIKKKKLLLMVKTNCRLYKAG